MSQILFRHLHPIRNCQKTFVSYRSYKKYLAADFNGRCGYTDCQDKWFGGISNFHIDHFVPHTLDPSLKTNYSNLVYACSYVNILKSNDDPKNYLDPCLNDYNQHFFRNRTGTIFPNPQSPQAVYMHKKLKLGLARYQVIWLLEKFDDALEQLEKLVDQLPEGSDQEVKIKDLYFELSRESRHHFKYLTK